ncbi:MAG: hypothetical protein GX175_03365 [Halanaerobiaceae bacterium]|jgi:hypothetical protein|nr:hypothetical protein [Halanaerobiaceae bacterium]
MEKSYQEILKILDFLNISSEGLVFRGSREFLHDGRTPCDSEAARDLIKRLMRALKMIHYMWLPLELLLMLLQQ